MPSGRVCRGELAKFVYAKIRYTICWGKGGEM